MILIVDDDNTVRLSLSVLLRREGCESTGVSTPAEALAAIRENPGIRLVVMDMNFSRSTSGEEGIELLRKVKVLRPALPVILITAWGSIPLAVEGMRLGAFDFITKPWDNREFCRQIKTALQLTASRDNDAASNGAVKFECPEIIGRSKAMTELLATAARIAATDAPVLLLGENGTGKELVAQAIHRNSARSSGPMVTVNIGGMPQPLFESEMFGHVKGAFTGAVADRPGRFEMADGGTIFLDEVGELDLSCQVKLLRVLQQHTFERIGENKTRSSDFRVIAATNADLPKMVRDRTFREDLYYRLNLITLRIPPLRERKSDMPLLVSHFAARCAGDLGAQAPEITADAVEYLKTLPFTGNIRELKNLVERTMLINGSADRLTADDFRHNAMASVPAADTSDASSTLEGMELKAIAEAMAQYRGNISRVADALGITRQTLYRKLEKYGMK